MPKDRPHWNDRYKNGDLPWETGRADSNLINVITSHKIEPCRALELGCGTGNNAMWLDEHGFSVTAIDLSPIAIETAIAKSDGAAIDYRAMDILKERVAGDPYGIVFDRGCFHSMPDFDEKKAYVAVVRDALDDGGVWLSLIGNADAPPSDDGPPRMTAEEVTALVEPYFEVLLLHSNTFDSDQPVAERRRCWVCLMKKR